ncbi:MAG: UPF0149 family protein [Chlorobiaceae bacterium]|nr:UPF0149 family protein [Chlorobiaceae bacterium]
MDEKLQNKPPEELTTSEYDELENFLLHESGLKHPMNLDALEGLMTALIIGTEPVMPAEWLPCVWGSAGADESPRFDSPEQGERIMWFIRKMMKALVYQINEHTADYVPLPDVTTFESDESKRHAARMWCRGFIEGMNLRPASWSPLLKNEKGASTILAISIVAGLLRDKLTLDEEKEYEHWKLIPDAVLEIREFWLARLQEEAEVRSAQVNAGDPGRNDPCPCGSGKKYKKCCWE